MRRAARRFGAVLLAVSLAACVVLFLDALGVIHHDDAEAVASVAGILSMAVALPGLPLGYSAYMLGTYGDDAPPSAFTGAFVGLMALAFVVIVAVMGG